MRKDILKNLADDAFEHFEKKEELVNFVANQYPQMTEQEVIAFAKTFAYVQMKKSEMEMVKITNSIEGNDLQKADHPHGYSEKNPKIDIYHKGKYHASTNWSKTLKQAKEKHLERNPEHKPEDVKAYYPNPKKKDLNKSIGDAGYTSPYRNKYLREQDISSQKEENEKEDSKVQAEKKKKFDQSLEDVKARAKKIKVEKKDRCWDGYEPTPGKKAYSQGSCKPIKKNAVSSNEIHLYKYEDGTAEIIWGDDVSDDQVDKIIKSELEGWEENSESIEKKEKPFRGYNPERHSKTGGLNDKFREKYNREHGSDLKRPVTGEVKQGSKSAKRRKSFCARMSGMKGATSKDGELTPKGASLKRWKC